MGDKQAKTSRAWRDRADTAATSALTLKVKYLSMALAFQNDKWLRVTGYGYNTKSLLGCFPTLNVTRLTPS